MERTDNIQKSAPHHSKSKPPQWADKFLQWYCHPNLLEEIQGDAYELFFRTVKESKWKANLGFAWNVLRFFRWKNIKNRKPSNDSQISAAMFKNILLVTLRNFLRQPGHSVLNVIGLSVAFACAFLILLWVAFEFSFDTFHKDEDTIFSLVSHVEADGNTQSYEVASAGIDVSSVPEIDKSVSVSKGTRWPHVLCFKPETKGEECIYLSGVYSNENLFSVFNFPIMHGDPRPLRAPNQIAISEKMARLLFNTDEAVGKNMKIDAFHDVVVASVFKDVPSNSSLQFDFVLPFAMLKKEWGIDDKQLAENFFNTYLKTTTAVIPSVLTEKLNHAQVLTEALKIQKVRYEALPLKDWRLKGKFENGKQSGGRMDYVVLFIVIGSLVVLMAVINFINMTTARATTRAKEIGIRKVTGAFRSSIILQFVGESFLIVLISILLAALMAQFALPYFNSLLGEQINLNLMAGWIPLCLLGFLMVISLLAGIYPAFILSSFQPAKVLKNQLSAQMTGSQRLRKSLLVVQLSVSIGIIIFSGVLYQQLNYVTKKNLGFDRENMIRLEPTGKLFRNFNTFKNELSKHSSIVSIAASNMNPLQAEGGNTGVQWPGKPKDLRISFKTIACSYEFPETFGLKILEGRDFQPKSADSLNTEVLVTEEAVKVMNLKQPLGEIIRIGDTPCVIIGVVNDFHTESLRASRQPVILYRTDYMHTAAVYVKYQPGTTQASLEVLGAEYKKIEPEFTMKYWFQDDTYDEIYKTEITVSRLVLLFTVVTLVISILGIAGLATYNVLRRTKEIGIRRVFGASIVQVLSNLTSEFSLILLFAMIIAGPLSWLAADKWLTGFAYRIAMPWWIYAITFMGIGITILLIICVQGLKTVVTNPSKTLRNE